MTRHDAARQLRGNRLVMSSWQSWMGKYGLGKSPRPEEAIFISIDEMKQLMGDDLETLECVGVPEVRRQIERIVFEIKRTIERDLRDPQIDGRPFLEAWKELRKEVLKAQDPTFFTWGFRSRAVSKKRRTFDEQTSSLRENLTLYAFKRDQEKSSLRQRMKTLAVAVVYMLRFFLP